MRVSAKVVSALLWLYAGIALCKSQSALPQGFSPNQFEDASTQLPTKAPNSATESRDPIRGVKIVYPVEGAVEIAPVVFQMQINVRPGGEKLFAARYDSASICVEVNGVTIFCSALHDPGYEYHILGNCTARVYLKLPDTAYAAQSHSFLSPPVSFSLVDRTDFIAHVGRAVHRNNANHRAGFQLSLVEWAQSQQRQPDNDILQRLKRDEPSVGIHAVENADSDDLLLVVGVRSAVVSHFPLRQAIRETWASRSLIPQGVRVIFLGCRPYATVPDENTNTSSEQSTLRRVWEAVELEKQVYGDLLTDELDCDDAYIRLADKTKEFLHLAATRFPNAQYAMIADDDMYLRLDQVAAWLRELGPRERFYVGHVREIENARKTPPTRIIGSPHYLSKQMYPLSELPPFALGANFFLSMDGVQFVSKNRRRLRDLGGMDDISVALWMLIRQVHPMHRGGLQHLKSGPCEDNLVTLSDLSASAIRLIHANVLSQRRFCHGFDRHVWMLQNRTGTAKGSSRLLAFPRENLRFDISRIELEQTTEDRLVITISTPNHAGLKASYFPLRESLAEFSLRLCALSRLNFPGDLKTCASVIERVRSALQNLYDELVVTGIASET